MITAARWMMYLILGLVCVIFAAIFCCWCAMMGAMMGFISTYLLSLIIAQEIMSSYGDWLVIGGAVIGAFAGFIFLLRLWWLQAKKSEDDFIRSFANRLDRLGCALTGRTPR